MRIRQLWSCAIAALVVVAGAGAARAVDGVIEINQAKADHVGFPVTISVSGSYRLTSNIHVPPTTNPIQKNAIAIMTSGAPLNITIDLNGFTIDAAQPAVLIAVIGGTVSLTVRNGTLNGGGINADGSNFNSLLVEGVSIDGIDRTADGITASGRSTVRDCRVRQCFRGIATDAGSVVDCTVSQCSRGIVVGGGTIASHCCATVCDTGIETFGGIVSGCLVQGSSGSGATDAGIKVEGVTLITGCQVTGATVPGILFFNQSGVDHTLVEDTFVNQVANSVKLNGQPTFTAPTQWHGNMFFPAAP